MNRDNKLRKMLGAVAIGFALILAIMGGSMTRVQAAGPITVNTTADELNTDGDCSLREAIQAANTDAAVDACSAGSGADVISFTLTTPAVITLTLGELSISADPLTITGPGANLLTIDGNDTGRIFNVTSVVQTTFSGMAWQNGNTFYDGGALLSKGDVTLDSMVFRQNVAGDDGGAINVQGTLVMTNTDVLSNTSAGFGGGVNTLFAPLTITGGRIENNTSGSWAGALYANGTLTISGTQFISNSAQTYSGAIFAWDDVAITNATFERNTATASDVGGIFVFRNAVFTDTRFISNTAKGRTGALFVRGTARISGGEFSGNAAQGGTAGALNVDGALDIDGTQFTDNTATGDGGALWYKLDTISIANAAFSGNHSDGSGGAIHIETNLVLTNTDFLSNTAAVQGGAVNAPVAPVTISGGTFSNNQTGLGGALYAFNAVTISGTQFISNTAQLFGGAVLAWNTADITLSRFERNTARDYNAGALYLFGAGMFTDTNFISNTAGQRYGAVWAGADVQMTGGSMAGNVATANIVGGMKVEGSLTADGATFSGNMSAADSGALDVRGNLTLTDVDVLNNSASGNGGGINSFGSAITISGGNVSFNSAAGKGGGLRADGALTVSGTQFEGNNAQFGGAVELVNSGWFSGTVFTQNTASANGGALDILNSLWLTNTKFISNTSAVDGGAVWSGDISVLNSNFSENAATAGMGGAIKSGAVGLQGVTFNKNTAGGGGGAIFAAGDVSLNGGYFADNDAGDRGGGIYSDGDVMLHTDGAYFLRNSARTFGGGIFSWQSVGISNSQFVGNSARDFSVGAVYANADTNIYLSNFDDNTAGLRVGAVWVGGDATISESAFRRNTAQNGRAGALDVGGSLWLTDTQFISNTAATDGGAVSLVGTGGRLVNVLFAQNVANNHGGALYLEHSGTANILHTTIVSPAVSNPSAVYVNATGSANFTDTIFSGYTTALDVATGTVTEDYDLFYRNVPVNGTVTRGGHSVTGNPMFDGNFRLTAGSWAINAGVTTAFNSDWEQDARPLGGAVDIGWDETLFTSDAAIAKTVYLRETPAAGDPITFTLTFSNTGDSALYGLVITDAVPASITGTAFTAAGAIVTDTGASPAYVWQVENLGKGAKGVITVTGTIARILESDTFTNTAQISTTSPDVNLANNISDVRVVIPNARPSAVDDTAVTPEDTAVRISPLANDTDDNPLFVAGVGVPGFGSVMLGLPAHGSAVLGNGTDIVYTPTLNYNGTDSFNYIVSDGKLTDTATITVTITPVNDAPVAGDDGVLMEENTVAIISPLGNDFDVDGDTLSVNGVGVALHGAVTISGTAQVRYTPDTNFFGTDSFSYIVSDGTLTDTATVTLTVAQNLWFNYLPMLFNDFTDAPDLVVSELIATENAVTVTIKNQGFAPVTAGFWVDVYIAPSPVPTQVNQIWSDVAAEGLVWGVDGDALAQLVPGGTLTLTIGDGLFDVTKSNFSTLVPGTPVYAQVDSVDLTTNYGGVLEIDELTNKPYNNISGTISTTGWRVQAGKAISSPLTFHLPER